jgi:hypothetical protein
LAKFWWKLPKLVIIPLILGTMAIGYVPLFAHPDAQSNFLLGFPSNEVQHRAGKMSAYKGGETGWNFLFLARLSTRLFEPGKKSFNHSFKLTPYAYTEGIRSHDKSEGYVDDIARPRRQNVKYFYFIFHICNIQTQ